MFHGLPPSSSGTNEVKPWAVLLHVEWNFSEAQEWGWCPGLAIRISGQTAGPVTLLHSGEPWTSPQVPDSLILGTLWETQAGRPVPVPTVDRSEGSTLRR